MPLVPYLYYLFNFNHSHYQAAGGNIHWYCGFHRPAILAAIPFVARLVETSLKEIEWGLIEAALSMGANLDYYHQSFINGSKTSLILGVAITTINLIGYSAMAGIVGEVFGDTIITTVTSAMKIQSCGQPLS